MRGRVYRVSFTRWPSPFIANLLNETCRAYIVRLLVPSVSPSALALLPIANLSALETLYRLHRRRERVIIVDTRFTIIRFASDLPHAREHGYGDIRRKK